MKIIINYLIWIMIKLLLANILIFDQWISYRFLKIIFMIGNGSVIGLRQRIINWSRYRKSNATVSFYTISLSNCLPDRRFTKRIAILSKVHLNALISRLWIFVQRLRICKCIIIIYLYISKLILKQTIIHQRDLLKIRLTACYCGCSSIKMTI